MAGVGDRSRRVLLFGYQVWPGVAAASLLLTLLSDSFLGRCRLLGNRSGSPAGAFLLRRIANFDHSLSRLRDALGLIVLGAFGGSVVSASIGVSALYDVHIRGWSGFGRAWLIYWLGDSTGILLVTPLMLALPALFRIRVRDRFREFAILLVLLTAVCSIVFGILPVSLDILTFAVLPLVMWAALRFESKRDRAVDFRARHHSHGGDRTRLRAFRPLRGTRR